MERLSREFCCSAVFVNEAVEGPLESEAVHDSVLSEEHNSGCFDFAALDAKLARVEAEHLRAVIYELGEDLRLVILLIMQRKVRPVHEN